MGWARVDDGFHDHPKVDELSLAAVGLWTLCLTWAHRHRRTAVLQGHITEARVRKLAGKQATQLSTELMAVGLWEPENGLGGYVIHDFADYLPRERDPEERREAGKKGAAKRWERDGKADGNLPSTNLATDSSRASAPASPTRPDPTRPIDEQVHLSPPTEVVAIRQDVERVCEALADLVEANGSKRPTVTTVWRDSARLLIDKDGRTEKQALWLINWCQSDSFWRGNVLSMPTFREKFDRLRLAAEREYQSRKTSNPWTG